MIGVSLTRLKNKYTFQLPVILIQPENEFHLQIIGLHFFWKLKSKWKLLNPKLFNCNIIGIYSVIF